MDLTKPPFEAAPNDDATRLSVTFKAQSMDLSAEDLDGLIAWLGHHRSQLKPPIPVALPTEGRFYFLDHCEVRLLEKNGSTVPTETGALFLFQSPLFGWFQHPATAEFCQNLIPWLQGRGHEVNPPSDSTLQ